MFKWIAERNSIRSTALLTPPNVGRESYVCHDHLRCSRPSMTDPGAAKLERFADELDLTQFRIDQLTALAVAAMRDQANLVSGRDHCLDCGDLIPAKRLIYVPNATRCAPCQDREERLGRGFMPGALVDKPQARRSV
ncbi:TraR/DksA C4-type zinc finger protein [Thiocapsa sp. UBA6158]|uniref:TraR/DksA C4-type zinc finger protein n=1 Tax=Thiocapsa sp. UBA6158 TaxID=1947692 RepID=UPI0025FD6D6D|nr:TraR/DksA C4-type zinc finger protein [Thiocapsa sp. UBA6158]